jgi:hypothetical protein
MIDINDGNWSTESVNKIPDPPPPTLPRRPPPARPGTVRELYEKLASLVERYPDYEVSLEGCDCNGEWRGEIDVIETSPYSPPHIQLRR